MALKLTTRGFRTVSAMLENVGVVSGAAVRRELEKGVKEIIKTAQENVPEDEGSLRAAIGVVDTDRKGINRRKRWTVGVNLDAAGTRTGGRSQTVMEYALMMHEHLMPDGDGEPDALGRIYHVDGPYGHGKGGGKFLERAFDDLVDDINLNVMLAVEQELHKLNAKK